MLCKHVRQIIAGDDSILYNRNQKNEFEKISNHLQKTQIPLLLLEIKKSEDLLEEAKRVSVMMRYFAGTSSLSRKFKKSKFTIISLYIRARSGVIASLVTV